MIEVWNLQNFVLDSKRLIIRQAKDKEQAVLYLHRRYDLQPVIYGAFRIARTLDSLDMRL